MRPARLLLSLALVGCGAKTGLEIERFDAALDAPHLDAGRDAGPDAPDAPVCRPGRFPVEPARADAMLVLDRSGSMRLSFDGRDDVPPPLRRWDYLRSALATTLPRLGERVRVGAKFYPDPIPMNGRPIPASVACRCSEGVDVPPAPETAGAILAAFDRFDPLGGTPTVEALLQARAALSRSTEGRRFIVLATDGGPNCNPRVMADPRTCLCTSRREACLVPEEGIYSCVDDPRTLEVMDETHRVFGMPIFVIGIPDDSRPDLTDYLDRMAVAGGRPRSVPGERAFYSARSERELREAFDQVTASISRCAFVVSSIPVGDVRVSVEVNGVVVPEDPVLGWSWLSRERGEFELHGIHCERANAPGARVGFVVDDCPDA